MSQSRFNHVFLTQRTSLLRTLERMVNNHSTAEDLLQERAYASAPEVA
ncbi:DNA-directed RNA polymerase specialized sigma24 family protein [Pseudomonas synxantha]|uniref:DNA-directed RNA polymerase specialized sigma24 family protein n=1 Tax=Pseudomonas synxantha TaxID=47883 RepID=A0ACC6JFM4_9PSED|nr:DNA-directed RNA polymerase specialized sigma24 family protein [Pseudomonas synxantha]